MWTQTDEPDVHAGAAEDLLAEEDGESHGEGEHPQRNVDRDDERDEEAGDEVALVDLLAADLGGAELDGEADHIGHDIEREDLQEAVEEHFPEAPAGAGREGSLITDIVHAEEGGGDQGDDHHDHHALEVDAVPDMGALRGHGAGNAEERVESVNG